MSELTHGKQAGIVEALQETNLFDAKTVGPNTISAISIMGEHEWLAGNVLRRLCSLGGEACAQTCVLHQEILNRIDDDINKKCADDNLSEVVARLGVKPENVLMVGVTADNIGFADEMRFSSEAIPISPVTGIRELRGYNAFFTREKENLRGGEIVALGRRLADCGDINLEFTDKDGKKVMGFMHMARTNLQGKYALKYDYDGKKTGAFEYFLRSAMDHYGADISSVNIRVAAAIKPENAIYTFTNEQRIDEYFPSWKIMKDENHIPFVKNLDYPIWEPGKPFSSLDRWQINYPAMLRWQMAQVKELQPEQINWDGFIDAGDQGSPHASNTRAARGEIAQGRDAYFTAWADKLQP